MGTGGGNFDAGDVLSAARLQQKTLFKGTGAEIAALTAVAGDLAYCNSTGSGFTSGTLYEYDGAAWKGIASENNTLELTNKTLNASVGKGTWTASGTWTLPAFTLGGDVTAGGTKKITDPILQNPLMYNYNRRFYYLDPINTTGEAVTGTAAFSASTNLRRSDLGATSGSTARVFYGHASTAKFNITRSDRKFEFFATVSLDTTITSESLEVGLINTDRSALSTSADDAAVFVYDAATSANWITRTANATSQTSNTSSTAASADTLYNLAIINDETNIYFYVNGTLLATHSTNLPRTTQQLNLRWFHINSTAANRIAYRGPMYLWTDNA